MARLMRWLKSWVCHAPARHNVVRVRAGTGMAKSITMPSTFNWPGSLVVLDEPTASETERWHVGWH